MTSLQPRLAGPSMSRPIQGRHMLEKSLRGAGSRHFSNGSDWDCRRRRTGRLPGGERFGNAMMPFVVAGPLSPETLPESAEERTIALSVVIPCFNEQEV